MPADDPRREHEQTPPDPRAADDTGNRASARDAVPARATDDEATLPTGEPRESDKGPVFED